MRILQLQNSLSHHLNDICVTSLDCLERLTEIGQILGIHIRIRQLVLVKLHQVSEALRIPILEIIEGVSNSTCPYRALY